MPAVLKWVRLPLLLWINSVLTGVPGEYKNPPKGEKLRKEKLDAYF